jgi:superfamily I DNA/RNA helicase
VAAGLGGTGAHRGLQSADGLDDGEVSVAVLRSETQEAQFVAGQLREAHLLHGMPWSQMAVVVRSTALSLPVLRRALGAAGVPVEVATEEVPLGAQPVVQSLLTLLRCVADPSRIDEEVAVELLQSPFGGADVIALRRLRQELRRAELNDGGGRASGALLVEAVTDPRALLQVPPDVSRAADRLARLLERGREVHERPESTA